MFEDVLLIQKRKNKSNITIMYLDLDKFKLVNGQFGHNMVDKVLIELSNRLRKVLNKSDTIARIEGDEFVIILKNIKDLKWNLKIIAKKIIAEINKHYLFQDVICDIGVSIGMLAIQDKYLKFDKNTLLEIVDRGMYYAKSK